MLEKRRPQLGVCVAGAATFALLLMSNALAQPRTNDVTATRGYLQAVYAKAREEASHTSAGITALETLGDQLAAECPGVLAGEPKAAAGAKSTSRELEIAQEVFGVFYGTVEHAEYALRARFAQTVASLHWGDRPLTRIIHALAAEEAARADIPFPNLCADLRAWVDSGYQAVTSSTVQYLRHLQLVAKMTVRAGVPMDMGAEAFIERRLARYESKPDKVIIRRTLATEQRSRPRLLTRFHAALTRALQVLGYPLANATSSNSPTAPGAA